MHGLNVEILPTLGKNVQFIKLKRNGIWGMVKAKEMEKKILEIEGATVITSNRKARVRKRRNSEC